MQVFFLISGFLLYRPMVVRRVRGQAPPRRPLVHAPPLPAHLPGVLGRVHRHHRCSSASRCRSPGGRSIFEYFFLIHLYDTGSAVVNGQHAFRALGGISQSWTLVVEVSFYIFLPFYAALLRRLGQGRDRESRFRLELLDARRALRDQRRVAGVRVLRRAEGIGGRRSSATTGCPANLDVFALGMGLAVVRAWADGRERARAAPRDHRPARLAVVAPRRAVLPGGVVLVGLPQKFVLVSGGKAYEKELLYSLTAFFLILPAVFGAQHTGRDAPLPAAPADGVPRHDLVRHLSLAPGLHREDAPVGRLVEQAAAQRAVPRTRDSRARD